MTFRHWVQCVALSCLGLPALAQDQRMVTEAEAPGWNAVGRVNVAGNRYCTGTLISPDEVITAAHCLFHPVTRSPANPDEIRFVAGFRRDSYVALTGVTKLAILPDFAFVGTEADLASIQYDVVLLKLDRPLLPSEATPLTIIDWPPGALNVDILGYGRDRPLIASIREACPYLSDELGAKLMDCVVVPGLSGGPVVVSGSHDVLALVTTSVGTRVKGEQSLVVPLAPHLADLRALIAK